MGIQVAESTTLAAAGDTSGNVLANTQLDYMPYNGVLEIGVTGGGSAVRATLSVGDQLVMRDQLINPGTAYPVAPDDFVITAGAIAGARIDLSFRNNTSPTAARTVQYVVNARPT